MELAGVAVGIPGILVSTYQLGRALVDLCQSLAHAIEEVKERELAIRTHWYRTQEQLKFLQQVWPILGEDHQSIQEQTLRVLDLKLTSANDKLRGLLKHNIRLEKTGNETIAVRRTRYLLVKPYLDATIKDLAKWQKNYDPSWWLIMRIANPAIDKELRRVDSVASTGAKSILKTASRVRNAVQGERPTSMHIFLSRNGLDAEHTWSIPYSRAKHARRTNASEYVIVDSIPCPSGSCLNDMIEDIRTLAIKLRSADPSAFGVLQCRGVIKIQEVTSDRRTGFDMIFSTPSPNMPRTLRSCLASRTGHTLSERVDVAKQLARSVNYVHTLDFVHKNIRPENFIGFDSSRLGSCYLVGFEHVRSVDGLTYLRGDADWQKNLYRHPERQGLHPGEVYCMQHDIYSLGVCLLEIGLWDSFVLYGEDGAVRSPNADLLGLTAEELHRKKPAAIKKVLIDLAQRELPARMGEIYEEVVVNCLTCLDEDNPDFGDASELEDGDEISVGVRYIEKILLRLNSISV